VSAPDLDALYAQAEREAAALAEQEATDAFIRQRFGTKPVDDLSGLFTGQPSLAVVATSVPPPTTVPVIAHGPREPADSDAAAMDAYMAAHFPQTRRSP
jgi:hypothetical protein